MLYIGVIEDRNDPLKLGRCKVRVIGLHTHDASKLPTMDLPWAIPMQPTTSAALSGIGTTPLGLIEGTSVIVMFQDEDKQYPIILGSIGGIPQSSSSDISTDDGTIRIKIDGEVKQTTIQSNVLLDSSGNAVVDSSGNPVTTTPVDEQAPLENTNKLKRASEFLPSANCIALIKRFEGLKLQAYQDSVGVWTIGYGTTRINGVPVQSGMTITQQQAERFLLDDLNRDFVPTVHASTRALVTQSMFDSLCSFAYNVGGGNLRKSTLLKDLNANKYLDAAAGFSQWNKAGGVVLQGLVNRRIAEKDLFLNEGIPNSAGELPPQSEQTGQDTQTTGSEGGFGSADSNSTATQSSSSTLGFGDPNRKYPLYFDEPDTNRLARHEEINKTVVYKKEASIIKGVQVPGSTWDQSPVPYNAQYPFNHVMQTESGHIMEFDDTPNSERIHIYHKAGTFTEIDANGTRVHRIVGDNYEILERNGYVQITGSLNVTVDGAHNVYVKNSFNMDIDGVANINIYNDANVNVSGNMNLSVGETLAVKATAIKMEADTVDIKTSGNSTIEAGGDASFKASGNASVDAGGEASLKASGNAKVDGAQVHLGMGANSANSAQSSGLSDPDSRKSPEMPEFGTLTVITRGASAGGQYETPEDGDPTAHIQKQLNTGALKVEDVTASTEVQEAQELPPPAIEPPSMGCDAIMMKQTFEPSFVLSKNFTLGELTKNGSRPVIAQQGLSVQEIVCNLKGLAESCLEPIKNLYPNMVITSGFRRPNDVPNSSKTSDHYLGCAVDIVIPNLTRQGHYEAIQRIQELVPYDQLLLEYQGSNTTWIHVSFKYSGAKKQIFTMKDHKRISNFGQFVLVA